MLVVIIHAFGIRKAKEFMDKFKNKFAKFDYIILILIVLLTGTGLYCIRQIGIFNPLKEELFVKQLAGAILGIVLLFAVMLIDYHFICKYSFILYLGILIMLAYLLKFGDAINNVRRWITIAGIQFQPSELTKVVLIVFLAYLCNRYKMKLRELKTLVILAIVTVIPFILILKEPHLSSGLAILFIFCVLIYSSGISYKVIGTAIAIIFPIAAGLIISVLVFNVEIPFVEGYQIRRILTFMSDDEAEDVAGKYQQLQAQSAISSGGLDGKTLSEADTDRVYQYIYANESDFIFSVVGEELGFVVSTAVILCYLVLIIRCLIIATSAPDYLGKLICMGVSALLTFQVFINVGVATSLLPNTGLSLPFISYGLTSLISSIIAVGLVLNVGLRRNIS